MYTIEGNSGDACERNSYPVGNYQILGYGTPIYAACRVDSIQPLTGESPYELQKRVQLEQQMEAGSSELVSEENSQEEPDQDHGMCMD